MSVLSYFDKIKKAILPQQLFLEKGQPAQVSTLADFQKTIMIERNRVNRNGGFFTILVFNLNEIKEETVIYPELIDIITKRVRISDQIGWYRHGQLGVILPETSTIGAKKLIQDLYHHSFNGFPKPPVEFYIYPYHNDQLKVSSKSG